MRSCVVGCIDEWGVWFGELIYFRETYGGLYEYRNNKLNELPKEFFVPGNPKKIPIYIEGHIIVV